MNIGVITSGGDAPGMNPCLAEIVKNARKKGYRVYGYKRGFLGICENDFEDITTKNVQGWYQLGGTVLKTGRLLELKEERCQRQLVDNLKKNSIEVLIVLGGDGSFLGAMKLHEMDPGLNIIGIPCTIDNNIYGSDYTIGFDTALNTQVRYLDGLHDTGSALKGRIFFVETLGAYDGYLPHSSVIMGMADFSVICECPMTDEEIYEKIKQLKEQEQKDYIMVMFAEGDGNHRCLQVAEMIKERLQANVKCSLLGFSQRGGTPTAGERLYAAGFAKYAIEGIAQGIRNQYVTYKNGKYDYMDITQAVKKKKYDYL